MALPCLCLHPAPCPGTSLAPQAALGCCGPLHGSVPDCACILVLGLGSLPVCGHEWRSVSVHMFSERVVWEPHDQSRRQGQEFHNSLRCCGVVGLTLLDTWNRPPLQCWLTWLRQSGVPSERGFSAGAAPHSGVDAATELEHLALLKAPIHTHWETVGTGGRRAERREQ